MRCMMEIMLNLKIMKVDSINLIILRITLFAIIQPIEAQHITLSTNGLSDAALDIPLAAGPAADLERMVGRVAPSQH